MRFQKLKVPARATALALGLALVGMLVTALPAFAARCSPPLHAPTVITMPTASAVNRNMVSSVLRRESSLDPVA